jgi:hypothetical protein
MEFRETTRFRWPDCVIKETLPLRDSSGLSESPTLQMLQAEGKTVTINARGELIWRDRGGRFERVAGTTSLSSSFHQYAAVSPLVVARRLQGEFESDSRPDVSAIGTNSIRITCGASRFVADLSRVPSQALVLSFLEITDDEGNPILAYRFSDFRTPEGAHLPVAFSRTLMIPQGGELADNSTDSLLAHKLLPRLGDDAFELDLTGALNVEPSTGIVRDSGGIVIGKMAPRRQVRPLGQWAIFLGAAGVGVVVVVAGLLLLHRRKTP